MPMLKKLSLILLCVLITGCATHTIGGSKTKSVSDLSPPRQYPVITFNIPRDDWPQIYSTATVKSSFEASNLFTKVIPDRKKRGGRRTDGLYIETTINKKDSTNPYFAVVSIISMGIIPLRLEYDNTIKTVIYIDRKKVKTYYDTVTTATIYSVIFPTPLLFGRSEEEIKKVFAARYVSNLLTRMHRDNVAFNK